MAGCPRLPRRETERERGRSVKFIVINRSWLDKRGSSSKLEEEAGTKEEEKSGATEGRETRAYRYSSPSLPTDNKFPTKVSRFDVDKVVAPTRCPRAFASLSKFLRRALVHIYIYISPLLLPLLVSPFLLSRVARIRDSFEIERLRDAKRDRGSAYSRAFGAKLRARTLEFYVWRFGVEVCQLHPSLPTLRNSSIFL